MAEHLFVSNQEHNCWSSFNGRKYDSFTEGDEVYVTRVDILTGEFAVDKLIVTKDHGHEDYLVWVKKVGEPQETTFVVDKARVYRTEEELGKDISNLINAAIWNASCLAHEAFMKSQKIVEKLNTMQRIYWKREGGE